MDALLSTQIISTVLDKHIEECDLGFVYGENSDGRYLIIILDKREKNKRKCYSSENHILGKSIRLLLAICDSSFFDVLNKFDIDFVDITTAESLNEANRHNLICMTVSDLKEIYSEFKLIERSGSSQILKSAIDTFIISNS